MKSISKITTKSLFDTNLLNEGDMKAINDVLTKYVPNTLVVEETQETQEDNEHYDSKEDNEHYDSKEDVMSKLYNDEEVTKEELEATITCQEDLDECLSNLGGVDSSNNLEDSLNAMEEVVEAKLKALEEEVTKAQEMQESILQYKASKEVKMGESQDAILEGYLNVKPIYDEEKEAIKHINEIKAQEWREYLKNQA